MPRRVVKPASPPPGDPSPWKATRHAVPTTRLLEFGPTWLGWPDDFAPFLSKVQLTGAICKVIPPASVPYSQVDALADLLYARGARTVRLLPALPEERPTLLVCGKEKALQPLTLRQVAIERARAMVNSTDQAALLALVNEAMDHGETAR